MPAELVEDNLTHTSLGKYHLIASLGGGGMAKVYLALMAGPGGFNKLLVIKVLREDVLSGSDESVHMFWDEARLAARLVHPNIVQTYEGGAIQGRYFLAMEYLDGQAYRAVQNRMGPRGLPLHEELRILSETARGLHYSHELRGFEGESLGVVHRDVSPQNVFITYDGQVKLLDFGIAKTTDSNHKTQVGVIKGKLDYIAPEQLRGDPIDRRADIFALGAMLWETVAGQRFAGGRRVSEVTKVHSRVTGGEPRIRDVAPSAPAALVEIIERAIALDPEARFQDAAAFADALDGYLEAAGQKPSARSLGELMSRVFEIERSAMHKLIEQQVHSRRHSVEIGETTGELPRMGSQDTRSSSGVWRGHARASERTHTMRTTSESAGMHGGMAGVPSSTGRTMWIVALALASVALGALLVSWRDRARAPEPVEPQLVATNAMPAEPREVAAPLVPDATAPEHKEKEEEPAATAVMLEVTLVPENASLTLDGTPVGLPFSGRFPKDGVLHRLEASADGYRPYKRFVSFDRDHRIGIVLERMPAAPTHGSRRRRDEGQAEVAPPEPRSAPAASAPRSPVPGTDMEAPRRNRPSGEIDTFDPYATTKQSIPTPR